MRKPTKVVQTYRNLDDEAFDRAVNRKYKEILNQELVVQQRRRNVFQLEESHQKRRNAARTTAKLKDWRNVYAIQKSHDTGFRAPDRRSQLRNYTDRDDAIWQREEMRSWYTKDCDHRPSNDVDHLATGYLVNIPERGTTPPRIAPRTPEYISSTNPPPRVSHQAVDARLAGGPHWMDHEGHVSHQSDVSNWVAQEATSTLQQHDGRVRGYTQPPYQC